MKKLAFIQSVTAKDVCASNARVYDKIKPCSFRQRLALHLGAKQNQGHAKVWPTVQKGV